MKITIAHNQPKTQIIAKMQRVFAELKEQYSQDISIKQEQWEGDKAYFEAVAKGFKFKGGLTVKDNEIEFEINIPLMLKPFEAQIKSEFETEFKKRILDE